MNLKARSGLMWRVLRGASIGLAGLALAGCGGSSDGLAPAAEPAKSPPLERRPAGRVVPIGHKPEGLVADARTRMLAVGLTNPDRLVLVNMDSGRIVRRIELPESPRHLRLAAPGGPVLVPAEHSDTLVEVFLRGRRKPRVTPVGDTPHDAASDGGRRIFVGDELGDTLSVVEDGRAVRTVDAPVQPGGVVTTSDGRVAVVGVSERALELFDARSLRRLGKIDVGIGPTHVAALGKRLFVVDTRGNALLRIRTRRGLAIRRRISLPGAPYGIAVDPVRRHFWVTLTGTNRVVELTDSKRLRSFPTVRQPNTVAVDRKTGRVFVGSRKDGTLQIIDPRPAR